jgi:hypothetical protein
MMEDASALIHTAAEGLINVRIATNAEEVPLASKIHVNSIDLVTKAAKLMIRNSQLVRDAAEAFILEEDKTCPLLSCPAWTGQHIDTIFLEQCQYDLEACTRNLRVLIKATFEGLEDLEIDPPKHDDDDDYQPLR